METDRNNDIIETGMTLPKEYGDTEPYSALDQDLTENSFENLTKPLDSAERRRIGNRIALRNYRRFRQFQDRNNQLLLTLIQAKRNV